MSRNFDLHIGVVPPTANLVRAAISESGLPVTTRETAESWAEWGGGDRIESLREVGIRRMVISSDAGTMPLMEAMQVLGDAQVYLYPIPGTEINGVVTHSDSPDRWIMECVDYGIAAMA